MTDTQPVTPARAQPVLVTLPAEIDMVSAGAAGGQLAAAFDAGVVVIADMTGTTFCDSMGCRMLVRACGLAGASGTDLRLLVTSPTVMRVMTILGLDAVLPLYQSLQDALAGLIGSGEEQQHKRRGDPRDPAPGAAGAGRAECRAEAGPAHRAPRRREARPASDEIEFTDRYSATGIPYPDPETACEGQCDGKGFLP